MSRPYKTSSNLILLQVRCERNRTYVKLFYITSHMNL